MEKLFTWRMLSIGLLLSGLNLMLVQQAVAQRGDPPAEIVYEVDWSERLKPNQGLQPHDHSLLGDAIDLQAGGLSFEQVDVSIPGNFDLPVEIRRRRNPSQSYGNEFADWQLVAPTISTKIMSTEVLSGTRWGKSRCSKPLEYAIPDSHFGQKNFHEDRGIQPPGSYSDGVLLHVPGRVSTQLLDKTATGSWPANAEKVTVADWYLTCITNIDGNGTEGFHAYAPNGDRYRFDVMRWRKGVSGQQRWKIEPGSRGGHELTGFGIEGTYYDVLAASEVVDVNGNWVRYDYDDQGRLTSIRASDGRRINLAYRSSTSIVVATVTANPGTSDERRWKYSYDTQSVYQFEAPSNPNGTATYGYSTIGGYLKRNLALTTVMLPDGRQWQFNLGGLFVGAVPGDKYTPLGFSEVVTCKQADQVVSVTHPDGMTGEFKLSERTVYMPISVLSSGGAPCPNASFGRRSSGSKVDMMSVVQKTLSGPGAPTATWKYRYETGGPERTTIIQPDGSKIYNIYPSISATTPSSITSSAVYSSESATSPLQITKYSYLLEPAAGSGFVTESKPEDSRPLRTKEVTITRGSDWYKTRYSYITNRDASNYSYGHPTKIEKWSSLRINGNSHGVRTMDITYLKNSDNWILGLTDTVTRNGKLFDDYDYDARGRLTSHTRFGVTVATLGYHSFGKLSTYEDALGRRTRYSNYHRGAPRTIKRADGTTVTHTIDDNGWLTSATNARGYRTVYSYDDAGRLTSIDLPDSWTDTRIAYTYSRDGQLQQTATKASTQTTTTYDAMLRPVQVRRQSLSGGGGNIYTETGYDAMGRAVFKSLPSTSAGSSIGIETDYDAFGRVTETRETAAGGGTTKYKYLAGNKTRVIDPLNNATTTTYSAYGDPGDGDAVKIEKPEGITVDQTYDIYGNLGTIAQLKDDGTFHESVFSYDASQRLCRRHIPETGDTLYSYNDANEMIAYAEGQPAGTGCATQPAAAKVILSYDLGGRLSSTHYPDPTPDINRRYDANGNLTGITRGDTRWAYSYNSIDLPDTEQLAIDNRTYTIDYDYDDDGNLTGKGFPSGRLYRFTNDGFGRPVSVKSGGATYLNNINYFANDTIKSLHRGNGGYYERNLNERQLVSYIGGNWGENLYYNYDALGRVIQIDSSDGNYNRLFDYDDAGRLTSASGPWGMGFYNYDKLNNITNKVLGGRSVDIEYDSLNRIDRVNDSDDTSHWRNYSHDARGNVIADGHHTFTYDFANQPVGISGDDNGTFVYDGNLRRVKEQVGGKTIYSLYDRSGVLLTREEIKFILIYQDGGINIPIPITTVTDYIHIGDKTFARVKNGEVSYPLNDHLGSAFMVADKNGVISAANTFNYTPFGETIGNDPGDDNQQGFTGHIEDATGLTYMQARYYDPVIGRFLQTDPVGYEDQMNLYAYVHNDPVNYTDPTGEIGVAGFIVGVALDVTVQVAVGIKSGQSFRQSFSNINVAQAGIAGLAGAAGAGLASGVSKLATVAVGRTTTNIVGNAVGGAAINAGAQVANNALIGKTGGALLDGTGSAALTGAVLGSAGGALGDVAVASGKAGFKAMSQADRALVHHVAEATGATGATTKTTLGAAANATSTIVGNSSSAVDTICASNQSGC